MEYYDRPNIKSLDECSDNSMGFCKRTSCMVKCGNVGSCDIKEGLNG